MCVQLRIPAATAEELNRCIEMLEHSICEPGICDAAGRHFTGYRAIDLRMLMVKTYEYKK